MPLRRLATAVTVLLAACMRREAPPPAHQPAHAPVSAADSQPAATTTPAPAPAEPQGDPARALLGSWDLSPAAGAVSPHLTLVIDSARGASFWGHVQRALSGDVELGPDNFRPFHGRVGTDGVARMGIDANAEGVPPPRTEVAGRVTEADWAIISFVWGGEEQVRPGRTWRARRPMGPASPRRRSAPATRTSAS